VKRDLVIRQRRVVMTLCSAIILCSTLAILTGASAAWWALVGVLPVACAYMAVLLRARRIMAEREMTKAFFDGASGDWAAMGSLEDLFPAAREPISVGRAAAR
jgi:hypothetical protein